MTFEFEEILETLHMTEVECLDVRTVTMGISLRSCSRGSIDETCAAIRSKILERSERLVETVDRIKVEFGIPIANKRISITPASLLGGVFSSDDFVKIALTLDQVAADVGIDYLAGYSAFVQKGYADNDRTLISSIPDAIAATKRVCSSVNVATTKAGINMDAVRQMGEVVCKTAQNTASDGGIGCAKLVTFANIPEDNPFVAGALHGISEPECVINVGISGPGVVLHAIERYPDADFGTLAEVIKRTAFKVTRMGEMVGRKVSRELGVEFGIVDLSLAPTPEERDSVARILEAIGVDHCGAHGTTAALAMLNDNVKKGGMMASSFIGGMSGAFIPVSEDAGMIEAVKIGALSIEKLEAMTAVCSVGLDMIAVPGDTSPETISGIIADEAAIGVINNKTTSVRIIPVPGKKVGESVVYGGLLGEAPIMDVSRFSCERLIHRGGRIPAPTQGLNN
jgi:uncharacterized protein (UPF0210 family)